MTENHAHSGTQHKKAPDLTPPVKGNGNGGTEAKAEGGKQKKEAKPKSTEPRAPRESALRKTYPDNAVIRLKTEGGKNPKRPGSKSFERFAVYKDGITVAEAVKAGVLYADLSWDVGHGFIAVESPTA